MGLRMELTYDAEDYVNLADELSVGIDGKVQQIYDKDGNYVDFTMDDIRPEVVESAKRFADKFDMAWPPNTDIDEVIREMRRKGWDI